MKRPCLGNASVENHIKINYGLRKGLLSTDLKVGDGKSLRAKLSLFTPEYFRAIPLPSVKVAE